MFIRSSFCICKDYLFVFVKGFFVFRKSEFWIYKQFLGIYLMLYFILFMID